MADLWKVIVLYRDPRGWMAWFSDYRPDDAADALLPTAYTELCPEERVVREIRALNPGYDVRVATETK